MKKQQEPGELSARGTGRARMLVAAILGALLLNPPLLEIFSVDPSARLFGWPLILFYINLTWILLIVMVFLPRLAVLFKPLGSAAQRLLGNRSD